AWGVSDRAAPAVAPDRPLRPRGRAIAPQPALARQESDLLPPHLEERPVARTAEAAADRAVAVAAPQGGERHLELHGTAQAGSLHRLGHRVTPPFSRNR